MPERRYPFIDYGDVADYAASLPPRLPVAPPTISDEQLTMQQLNRDNAPLEWFPAVKESVGKLGSPLASGQEVYNRLTGSGGQERYQTWPEQLVRSGFALPADVYSGRVPTRDPLTGRTSQEVIERAQDLSGLMGGGSVAGVGARGVEPNTLGVVPVPKAKSLNIQRSVPSETLRMAAENTPGALIDAEGDLIVNVGRKQQPNQEMSESVRGGVFYLPAGDRNFRHYGTPKSYYGGQQKIEGETAFLNPLTVKGATGGKAPEAAYTQLMGKEGLKQLDQDVMDIVSASNSWMRKKDPAAFDELVQRFFTQHAPELGDLSGHILEHSTLGNQLKYALREAAIGSAVRKAGHDGIIGYSTKRGADGGKPFISEIFDIREDRYPSPSGEYSLHPQFLSDTSANAPISALAKPVFYSALEHAVGNSKMPKADAEQWLGYLRNQPGVKQEELDFVLHDLPKGQITKPELEQYVQQHKVELKEVNKGDKFQYPYKTAEEWERAIDVAQRQRNFDEVDRLNIAWEQSQGVGSDVSGTKYSQWQLPGGENYREMLLTLPDRSEAQALRLEAERRGYGDKISQWPDQEFAQRYRDKVTNATDVDTFQSSHWDGEPNVLVHIRTNERNIPGVGNSLHVEEIQSDLHQAGRKQGYIGEKEKLQPKFDAIEKKILDSNDESIMANPELKEALADAVKKKIITADEASVYKRYSDISAQQAAGEKPIINAPFKSDWSDLALKRVIVQAAREGKDTISWTPGEAQALRYQNEIRQKLNNIEWHNKELGKVHPEGNRTILVTTANGNDIHLTVNKKGNIISSTNNQLKGKKLDVVLGKDIASQILEENEGNIDAKGYVMNSEPMKAYYNKMLVDKANAIAKKFGGKVEQANLGDTNPKGWHITPPDQTVSGKWMVKSNDYNSKGFHFDTEAEARANLEQQIAGERTPKQPVHVLRITPELRDAALNKGFSLFADTGKVGAPLAALSRVEHNPFKLGEMAKQHGVKLTPVEGNPFTATAFHGSPNPLQGERIRPMSGIGIIEKDNKFIVRDKINNRQIGPEFNTAEDAHNFVDKNALADFYSTPNPRLAQDYATQNVHGKGPNITPLRLDIRDYHTVDAKSQPWDAINQFAINEANQLGKKGVIIKNVFDDADPMRNSRGPQTVYITLDPSTVRSKFAKFDPAKYGESGLLKAAGLPIYMDKDGNRLLPTHTQAEYEHLGGKGAAKAAEWLAFLGAQNYPKINAPLTAAWIAQWPMMAHLLKEDINRQLKNGTEPSDIKFDKGSVGNMFGVIGSLNKKFGNKTLVPHEGNPFSTASK